MTWRALCIRPWREEYVVALAGEVAKDVAAREVAKGRSGSVLVFLPGWQEIKDVMKLFDALPAGFVI